MRFLYIDSNQIMNNKMLWGLLEMELDVERSAIKADINESSEQVIMQLCKELEGYDVALTQNFVPDVAVACSRTGRKYISWIYDSPQMALFTKEASFDTNYIFMFDKAGVDILRRRGIDNVHYYPLAANMAQASGLYITDEDIEKYSADVSFVGSLYSKAHVDKMVTGLSSEARADFDAYVSENVCSFTGRNIDHATFSRRLLDELATMIRQSDFDRYNVDPDYFTEILVGAPYLAHVERISLLNRASKKHDTRLYTNDTDTNHILAKVCPPVDAETDMYKVFFSSKINLNITHRGIVTGLPQRVFDIASVGGFVFTNYQAEVDDFFREGRDIECFRNEREFDEKLEHYLNNENERISIAMNGYKRVRDLFNYRVAFEHIFKVAGI